MAALSSRKGNLVKPYSPALVRQLLARRALDSRTPVSMSASSKHLHLDACKDASPRALVRSCPPTQNGLGAFRRMSKPRLGTRIMPARIRGFGHTRRGSSPVRPPGSLHRRTEYSLAVEPAANHRRRGRCGACLSSHRARRTRLRFAAQEHCPLARDDVARIIEEMPLGGDRGIQASGARRALIAPIASRKADMPRPPQPPNSSAAPTALRDNWSAGEGWQCRKRPPSSYLTSSGRSSGTDQVEGLPPPNSSNSLRTLFGESDQNWRFARNRKKGSQTSAWHPTIPFPVSSSNPKQI